MKTCPKCLGNKEIFNGEDYGPCDFCNGVGIVTNLNFENYDPMEEINNMFNSEEDDFENT